jgi:alpha-galactosidase
MAEIAVFLAKGYFNFKDTIKELYNQNEAFNEVFNSVDARTVRSAAPAPPRSLSPEKAGAFAAGGYETWYNRYTKINESIILEDLGDLAKSENLIKKRFIDKGRQVVFQIDDGWERAVGDWDINSKRFPGGLAAIAAKVEAKGWMPGLWLAPLLVTRKARIWREKPEWVLRGANGGSAAGNGARRRVDNAGTDAVGIGAGGQGSYVGDTPAGGAAALGDQREPPSSYILPPAQLPPAARRSTAPAGGPVAAGWNPGWDGEYYCLDISRDDVIEYLRAVMDKIINEWGYRYIKLDFMYAGFLWGKYANGGSPHIHYHRVCAALTERKVNAAGKPVVYLGCGVPFGPSYKFFPLSRIGADTRQTWDWWQGKLIGHPGRPSAWINLRDTIGRSFMNGAVYINDPDVVFLRSVRCSLTNNEKELIALTNFMLAGQIMLSDAPGKLTEADVELTARVDSLYSELEGEEYGAERLGIQADASVPDTFRLFSRSGQIGGIINLDKRPFQLGPDAALTHELAAAEKIVCHWAADGGIITFEPHSISIWRN